MVRHRLGSIVGNPSFEGGLQQYTDRITEVYLYLHGQGITDFTVRVVTGDTVDIRFERQEDATMFRLRWHDAR